MSNIRTRIAPSPTGYFHIGTARAALFNYLYARRHGGQFILRIEDTDRERSKREYEGDILQGLSWLGIDADEGPENGGPRGPYRQSERTGIYKEYITNLLASGRAGWCNHQSDATEQAGPHWCERHGGFGSEGEGIIRFKNPFFGSDEHIRFDDLIRGFVLFPASTIGDFSIAKSPDEPLYNLAVVVDDDLMNITHVIRGEDHLSNTPKQLLLLEALGMKKPVYAHVPLILGADRSKLSKRHGATSLREFRERGYLPEAMINMMALLGWNPGDEREFFTLPELEKAFSLERVQKSGAMFSQEKLDSINAHYIRRASVDELADLLMPFCDRAGLHADKAFVKRVVAVEQPRLRVLSGFADQARFFFELPAYGADLLVWKGAAKESAREALEVSRLLLTERGEHASQEMLQKLFFEEAKKNFESRGYLLWPLRVALSGQKTSPGPFEIIEVLGVKESVHRIDQALSLLEEKR